MNLANAVTMLRVLLIPAQALLIDGGNYRYALLLFMLSAFSDFVDGFIARHFNQRTRFGAIADPLADKLTMLVITLLLALQGWLPWWFAVAVIGRDVVIVSGALCYHWLIGRVEVSPTVLSKFNTGLLFSLLAGVLSVAGGMLPNGSWLWALIYATTMTIVLTGLQYVIEWSLKAVRSRRAG